MIVSIRVGYGAAVVRKGCRREEQCLLLATAHLRINEASPPIAAVSRPRPERHGATVQSPVRLDTAGVTGRWFEGEHGLLSETGQGLQALIALQDKIIAERAPSALGFEAFSAPGNPFQCMDSSVLGISPPDLFRKGGLLRAYPEEIQTRSRRFLTENGRDETIAFATRAARESLVHAEHGVLLVPGFGPIIQGGGDVLHLVANASPGDIGAFSYSATEMARAEATLRGKRQASWEMQVHRPAAFTWNSDAAALQATALAALPRKAILQRALDRQPDLSPGLTCAETLDRMGGGPLKDPGPEVLRRARQLLAAYPAGAEYNRQAIGHVLERTARWA